MSVLPYVLGDRAGMYLLIACLLVIALSIIAAIIDIPLRTLWDAGIGRADTRRQTFAGSVAHVLGVVALFVTFGGAAAEAYLTSAPGQQQTGSFALFVASDVALVLVVLTWSLAGPLVRHWGLCLGLFGLGLSALFASLAVVLKLDFQAAGTIVDDRQRAIFATVTGVILLAVAACLTGIGGLGVYVARRARLLAREHRRHRVLTSLPLPRTSQQSRGAMPPAAGSPARARPQRSPLECGERPPREEPR